jgi:hypothetical protein
VTAKQIAEAAGVSERTVQRTAMRLMPEQIRNGERADFGERESVAIMAALRKRNFVEPRQNDEVPRQNGKLPISGTQLREMRLIYGERGAGARLDHLMGWAPQEAAPRTPLQIASREASMPKGRAARQLAGLRHRIERDLERERRDDALQHKIDFNGSRS